MNRYQIIEFLHVNRDQLTATDIWQVIDQFDASDLIDIAGLLWRFNHGIEGSIIIKMDGIYRFYQETNHLSERQHRWLGMAILNNWDKLNYNRRLALNL